MKLNKVKLIYLFWPKDQDTRIQGSRKQWVRFFFFFNNLKWHKYSKVYHSWNVGTKSGIEVEEINFTHVFWLEHVPSMTLVFLNLLFCIIQSCLCCTFSSKWGNPTLLPPPLGCWQWNQWGFTVLERCKVGRILEAHTRLPNNPTGHEIQLHRTLQCAGERQIPERRDGCWSGGLVI